MTDSFPIRAASWLHGHDTGLSSEAIFHYMTLGVLGGYTPADGGDLGRCVRLLDSFPEWNKRMPEMARVSDDWAALVPLWDGLVAAYREDIERPRGEPWQSDEMLSALWWDKSAGRYWTRRKHGFTASGTEARRAETPQSGSVHDGPVPKADAR
jgi:hypothetical protein